MSDNHDRSEDSASRRLSQQEQQQQQQPPPGSIAISAERHDQMNADYKRFSSEYRFKLKAKRRQSTGGVNMTHDDQPSALPPTTSSNWSVAQKKRSEPKPSTVNCNNASNEATPDDGSSSVGAGAPATLPLKGVDSLRQLLEAPARSMFGIAAHGPSNRKYVAGAPSASAAAAAPAAAVSDDDALADGDEDNDSDDDAAQSKLTSKKHKKARKTKDSKLRAMRTAFDKKYRLSRLAAAQAASGKASPTQLQNNELEMTAHSAVSGPSTRNVAQPSTSADHKAGSARTTTSNRRKAVHRPLVDSDTEFCVPDETATHSNADRRIGKPSTSDRNPATTTVNRRKAIHRPLANWEQMEFQIEPGNRAHPDRSAAPEAAAAATSSPTISLDPQTLKYLKTTSNYKNPNASLMRQVADMQVSLNCLMRKLGRPEFKFERGATFEELCAQYRQRGRKN